MTDGDRDRRDAGAAAIRLRPHMYVGGDVTGERLGHRLLSNLAEQLLILKAGRLRLDEIDGWWVIESNTDWLDSGQGPDLNLLTGSLHFPQGGLNACRSDVVTVALARSLVTAGRDGSAWITGNPEQESLPPDLRARFEGVREGRVLAFTLPDKSTPGIPVKPASPPC